VKHVKNFPYYGCQLGITNKVAGIGLLYSLLDLLDLPSLRLQITLYRLGCEEGLGSLGGLR